MSRMVKVKTDTIARLLKRCQGNPDKIATKINGQWRPEELGQPLTVEKVMEVHVAGEAGLGVYPIFNRNKTNFLCIDIDNHEGKNPDWQEQAERVATLLTELEVAHDVEISSSGIGCHIWIWFRNPALAVKARLFAKFLSVKTGVPLPEYYPRQDELEQGQVGNLICFPYWNKSHFVDAEDWEETIPSLTLVDSEDLDYAAASVGYTLSPDPIDDDEDDERDYCRYVHRYIKQYPNSVLAKRANCDTEGLQDQSKSAAAMSFTNEMVRLHTQPQAVKDNLIVWCDNHDYAKGERKDWIERTIQKAYKYQQTKQVFIPTSSPKTFAECGLSWIENVGSESYAPFGIPALDHSMDGIGLSEMYIYAARPNHCKTALGIQFCEHNAAIGNKSLMIQCEMGSEQQGKRSVMRALGHTEEYVMENKAAVIEEWREHCEKNETPIFVTARTIEQIEELVVRAVGEQGVSCVCIDYAQLVQTFKKSPYESVTEVSKRLKGLTVDLNIRMLLLAQVGRGMEQRSMNGGRVSFYNSDLKESGQLEQDADGIMYGWWWARSGDPNTNPNMYEVHCKKRRNGPIREELVRLLFNAERQTFQNW